MDYYIYKDELYHHGVKGMKWGVRRYDQRVSGGGTSSESRKDRRNRQKIQEAEKYLGRKLSPMDGFKKDGSNITKKRLKNVKRFDEQEKRYDSVKKKDDPSYRYLRGHDVARNSHLSEKDVDRIIKKLDKKPSTDVRKEMNKRLNVKFGAKAAAYTLTLIGAAYLPDLVGVR